MCQHVATRMSETIILNDYGSTTVSQRRKELKSGALGKAYVTIDVQAEPLVGVFDDLALGAGPAQRLQDLIKEQISAIVEPASNATAEYRRRAEKAYEQGAGWAKKRYKKHTPNAAKRGVKFNDSNRLRDSIRAAQRAAQKDFIINISANRLIDHTAKLADDFVRLVPALRNPASVQQDKQFQNEIENSLKLMLAKANDIRDLRRVQLRQARINALKAAYGLARALGGL